MRMLAVMAALAISIGMPERVRGCNAMSGSQDCDSPYGFLPGYGESRGSGGGRGAGNLPPMSTLGGDLTFGGGSRPGTIGAVTFGSGGRKCSGMFRSTNC